MRARFGSVDSLNGAPIYAQSSNSHEPAFVFTQDNRLLQPGRGGDHNIPYHSLNDPRDIFAPDEWADQHPSVYAPRERPVSPDAVAIGEANAVTAAAKKKAMLDNLARARTRGKLKRSGRCRGLLDADAVTTATPGANP